MAENVVMTQAEFASLTPGEVQIIDIRDASSTAYGIIPGAKNIPSAELMDRAGELDAAKPAILYCARGIFSVEAAENLRGRGINAFSLDEGYAGWVMAQMQRDEDEAERLASYATTSLNETEGMRPQGGEEYLYMDGTIN